MATERLLELRRLAELRGVDVPRETTAPGGDKIAPTPVDEPESLLDKAKGVGEAGLTLATGAAGVIPAAAAGAGSAVTGGLQAGLDRFREFSHNTTYQPRGQAGQRYIGNVAQAIDESKLAGMNPAVGIEAAALSRPAMSAARQTAGKVPAAVAASPEGEMMSRAASGAKLAATPKIEPQTADLVKKAQMMGIKVAPDMLTDNKFLKIAGQASRDVPLSGAATADNHAAFNQAIIKAFGGDEKATKISPKVFDDAMSKHGKAIGDLSAKYPIDQAPLNAGIAEYTNSIRNETPAVRDVVRGYLQDIDKAAVDGKIDGTAFKKLRSELGAQMRNTSAPELKAALSGLDDVMLDAIQKNLKGGELEQFNAARKYYANGKTVEPLVANAAAKGRGDMSPAALANRVTASGSAKTAVARGRGGDLADIAAVGSRFLTEPKSSFTAERGATDRKSVV